MALHSEEGLDLRQRKTRALLVQALTDLLSKRPFQELSVADICAQAMVHRTTFYAHFTDKQDLLRYLLQQMEQDCITTCLPQDGAGSPRQYVMTAAANALRFFRAHKDLYRACVKSGADIQSHVLEECAAQELCRRLSQPQFRQAAPNTDPQIAARFYTGAMLSLIRWWLQHDAQISEETLLANLERFIPMS